MTEAQAKRAHTKLVGIAQMVISGDPEDTLAAPNLGSCLGIAVYDPKRCRGGMVHCLLPLSQKDPAKAQENPAMYVDTGVGALLNDFLQSGSRKEDLIITVAGGSQINDENGVFDIGKKNHTVLRKVLWKNGLLLKAEDFGGNVSRTISLQIGTGEVWLKVMGESRRLA